jgi:integrase
MIELDAFAGLRRGELIGLRWQDVDFESLILHIRRSVAAMVEGAPKTEASLKDVPLDAQTAESLWGLETSLSWAIHQLHGHVSITGVDQHAFRLRYGCGLPVWTGGIDMDKMPRPE